MVLRGKKTILRPMRMSEAGMLFKWIGDPRINRYLTTVPPKTLAQERAWLKKAMHSKTAHYFVIERKDTKEPIGTMSIQQIDKVNRKALTGAFIALPKYWGKGYGSDAKMALLKFAFLKLKLNRVESHAFASNLRSRRYNQKCGYKVEGFLRQNVFVHGRYIDDWMLAVLKKDWLALAKRKGYL